MLCYFCALRDRPVPYGTVLSRDAFPGTSCQATIGVVPPGRDPAISNSSPVGASVTSSISLGLQILSKNDSIGLFGADSLK